MKSDNAIEMAPPLAYFACGGNYPMFKMMKSEWFPLLRLLPLEKPIPWSRWWSRMVQTAKFAVFPILLVGGSIRWSDDEIGMVPPLAEFASGGELYNDQDNEIGIVPPLAYFASGRNCPMIRMMTSEYVFMLPYLNPFTSPLLPHRFMTKPHWLLWNL